MGLKTRGQERRFECYYCKDSGWKDMAKVKFCKCEKGQAVEKYTRAMMIRQGVAQGWITDTQALEAGLTQEEVQEIHNQVAESNIKDAEFNEIAKEESAE